MIQQLTSPFTDQLDDRASPTFKERVGNASIIRADIGASFEEYLEIFDAFYDEGIEASSGTAGEPIRGKARVRSLLLNFLIPLHTTRKPREVRPFGRVVLTV